MTELEKRAEEYSIREIPFIECISQLDLERLVKQAYIAGATQKQTLPSRGYVLQHLHLQRAS